MSDHIIVKYPREIADFIEACASRSDEYYWFPLYYKKVGHCLFEVCEFRESSGQLAHIVEQLENPNPDINERKQTAHTPS